MAYISVMDAETTKKSAKSFDPAAMLGEKSISVLPQSCELTKAS
ncbi:hypothetical protein [Mesorhizobium sp.]|nr:hypothetical protein [Mesorhizobium sp.]